MTARQKEMAAIKEQIAKLEERLEYLSKLPDSTIEDELLCSFDDFPWIGNIVDAIYFETENRLIEEGADYVEKNKGRRVKYKFLTKPLHIEDLTVKDLISCEEKTIASYRGIGKGKMGALKSWMEKYDLHFIG